MTANTPASRKAKGGGCSGRSGRTWSTASVSTRATSCRRRWGSLVATSTSRRRPGHSSPSPSSVKRRNGSRSRRGGNNAPETRQQRARPLLVFKRNREEPLAVLRWEDLLALLSWQDSRWQNLAEGLTGGRP